MTSNNSFWFNEINDKVHACNCVGPKNGQPVCPCAMRGVRIIDGDYVRIEKLGKVKDCDQ